MTLNRGRRRWLAAGCAHCLAWAGAPAWARTGADWAPPSRIERPDIASDEGGLWAIMDREEVRLRRGSFLVRDASLRDYLSGIVCKLGGAHCQDTRVYAVRTAQFNALMAPNGMMQVWTGLLLRLENEAQLAGVIGHELGHYLQRHSIERQRGARSASAFASLMASFGLVGLLGQFAAIAGHLSYERSHEHEADGIGVALMRRAGYDPREAAKVWANLRSELSAGPGGDPAKRSILFASHPGIEERQGELERLAGSEGGFLGTADYQARIEPFLWGMLEDELQRAQYDETIVLLDRHVASRPGRGDFLYFRGEARRLRALEGDLAHARVDLEASLQASAAPAQAHRSLGLLHRSQGRNADAHAAFQRYLESMPGALDAGIIKTYLDELRPTS